MGRSRPAASSPPASPASGNSRDETLGLWLGVLGVAIFAMTLPMTRLATGPESAPQLSPWFVTFGRAAVAGLLSLTYLLCLPGLRPRGRQWLDVAVASAGTVIGFPLLLALGLRQVESVHASVIMGFLPLITGALAALAWRQRPSWSFWACALLGSALVVTYALLKAGSSFTNGLRVQWADVLLVLAVFAASCGYVSGARLTPSLGAQRVICWVLVASLPMTLPVALWMWPVQPVQPHAWLGFSYVAVFSMWLGFFAWYRALSIGGAVRVSQVQLLQPFFSILFSVPLLGERIDAMTLGFALAVIGTVFLSKRMSTDVKKPA